MEPFKIAIPINICKRHVMNYIINDAGHADCINCLKIMKKSHYFK